MYITRDCIKRLALKFWNSLTQNLNQLCPAKDDDLITKTRVERQIPYFVVSKQLQMFNKIKNSINLNKNVHLYEYNNSGGQPCTTIYSFYNKNNIHATIQFSKIHPFQKESKAFAM